MSGGTAPPHRTRFSLIANPRFHGSRTRLAAVFLVGLAGSTLRRFAWIWLTSELFRQCLYWAVIPPAIGVFRLNPLRLPSSAAIVATAASTPVWAVVRWWGEESVTAALLAGAAGLALAGSLGSALPAARSLVQDVPDIGSAAARRPSA